MIVCKIREDRDLLALRKICSAFPKIPCLLYGRVYEQALVFQLGKIGIEDYVHNPNWDQLLQKLWNLKERATFRIDLSEFGIYRDQCRSFWTKRFLDFIVKDYNFLKFKSVSEIARKLGISTSTLEHSFTKDCLITVKQLLLGLRHYYAGYLLVLPEIKLSMTAVSRRCNFQNQSQFSKSFRIACGVTPRNFRMERTWEYFPALFLHNKNKMTESQE